MGTTLKLLFIFGCLLFICSEIQAFKRQNKMKFYDANDRRSLSQIKHEKDKLHKLILKLKNVQKRHCILTHGLEQKKLKEQNYIKALQRRVSKEERKLNDKSRNLRLSLDQAANAGKLKLRLISLTNGLQNLERRLSTLPQKVETCDTNVANLPVLIDNLKQINTILIRKVEDLTLQLNNCNEIRENKLSVLTELQDQIKDLEKQLSDLNSEVDATKQKIVACKGATAAELDEQIAILKKTQRAVIDETLQGRGELEGAQKRLDGCVEGLENLTEEIAELQTCNDTVNEYTNQCDIAMNGLKGLILMRAGIGLYYVEQQEKRTFQGAVDFCRAHGMELASVEDPSDHLLLINAIFDLEADSRVWIGLNSRSAPGDFTFVGTGAPVSETSYWGEGQPAGPGSCVSYFRSASNSPYSWHLADCGTRARFVCDLKGSPCRRLVIKNIAKYQ